MAASFSDSWQLSQDPVFQNRVQASLISACISISNEGWAVAFHRERAAYASIVLSAPLPNQYALLFANSVPTDPTVIGLATQAGTVVLTPANRAAQALLVTDVAISNAIASEFNSYQRLPGN